MALTLPPVFPEKPSTNSFASIQLFQQTKYLPMHSRSIEGHLLCIQCLVITEAVAISNNIYSFVKI